MGNASPSKLVNASKLVDSNQVGNLSFLEDGEGNVLALKKK